ncbi:MAG: hypothetical protein NTW91_09655, partial [Verrucomicrobia bacterium]|nr:hypothetical protein [Verrucomicrobiota bacterium]
MLQDSATPDLTTPVSSQIGFPLACFVQDGLDSVPGPMNLPIGISAGSDTTLLNDGSFLLAGNTTDSNNAPVLIHYNMDGSLDSSFGTGGYLSGPAGGSQLSATQLSNGEFLVSSQVSNKDGSTSEYFAEFTGSGQSDTTVGGGAGQLIAPSGTNLNGVPQVLNDGSFLVSANMTDGRNTPVLVNYNADGSINSSFGNNGIIIGTPGTDYQYTYQDSNSGEIVFKQFANQADGSIAEVDNFYTATGQLDESNPSVTTTIIPGTFDLGPIAIDPIIIIDPIVIDPIPVDIVDPFPIVDPVPEFPVTEGGNDGNSSLTTPDGYSLDGGVQVLIDGTSLASGFSSDGSKTPVLVNYNADGSINTSFGINGTIIGTPGTDFQYAYEDSNSGRIVSTQYAYQADGSLSAVVTYYTTSGQLDPSQSPFAYTFNQIEGGNDGNSSLTAPDGYSLDGGVRVLMDGTSLALGFSSDGSKTPVLVNYNADGSINTSFGINGTIIGT